MSKLIKGALLTASLAIIIRGFSFIYESKSLNDDFVKTELLYKLKLTEASPVYVDRMNTYSYLNRVRKEYVNLIDGDSVSSYNFNHRNEMIDNLFNLKNSVEIKLDSLEPLFRYELKTNTDLDYVLKKRCFEVQHAKDKNDLGEGFIFLGFIFGVVSYIGYSILKPITEQK